jgi:hypothetical protein
VLDPDREAELLAGAEDKPLYAIKERCQKARATSRTNDPIETAKRIYASRHFSSWSDAEGAFCYQGRDTADRGAQILARIAQVGGGLRRAQRSGDHPVHEHDGAVRADAFYALVTRRSLGPDGRLEDGGQVGDGGGGLDSSIDADGFAPGTRDENSDDPLSADSLAIIDRPPTCSVMVRVDLAALLRGTTHPGECCAIDNQGPISVPMARDMANDSYMRFVFHEAGDIRAVSHFGRTINRHLRTALAYRDMTCVVPGCGVSSGLEIDHVIPFAEGGPTALENLTCC